MPPKKGKGKGKKKGGKKKKLKGLNENPEVIVKRVFKNYENQCLKSETPMIPYVKRMLKDCIENNQLWVKIIVEPLPQLTKDDPQVKIEPLVAAIRGERYTFIKDIYIWDVRLKHETAATLALLIEKGFYQIRLLELEDCLLEPLAVKRLSMSFNFCKTLTSVCLDFNEFGDEGCQGLCVGLEGNKSILSLSLCYCDLAEKSGAILGEIVSSTAIRELLLDGNNLGSEGVIELVKKCAEFAELETSQKLEEERRKQEEEERRKAEGAKLDLDRVGSAKSETSDQAGDTEPDKPGSAGSKPGSASKDKKKKKGKKKGKKKKEPPAPPPVGPWIQKLHLADNGIDVAGTDVLAPIVCMRILKKLIVNSSCLAEIDLDKNLIGDLAARCIMDGLKQRKEASLPSMGVRVTHRISDEVYSTISKLGAGVKKKKGRKGKGKKKKK